MINEELLKLGKEDLDFIIQGVEALNTKEMGLELVDIITDGLFKPDFSKMSEQQRSEYEERKTKMDWERAEREKTKRETAKKVEIIKAKLVILRESL